MVPAAFTVILATAFSVLLVAQESTGTITGRVFDGSGAAIAGVEVTAVQTDTGRSRKAKQGSDGSYSIPNLPIGPYEVTATHSGFKKSIQTGLVLHVSEHLGQNIAMQVGDVTQEISVISAADTIQTESRRAGQPHQRGAGARSAIERAVFFHTPGVNSRSDVQSLRSHRSQFHSGRKHQRSTQLGVEHQH
jgi:hypothetical protein